MDIKRIKVAVPDEPEIAVFIEYRQSSFTGTIRKTWQTADGSPRIYNFAGPLQAFFDTAEGHAVIEQLEQLRAALPIGVQRAEFTLDPEHSLSQLLRSKIQDPEA